MATKKIILHVCDRCHHEQEKPLSMTIKVNTSAKKWTTWELCSDCSEGFGDYLVAGVNEREEEFQLADEPEA